MARRGIVLFDGTVRFKKPEAPVQPPGGADKVNPFIGFTFWTDPYNQAQTAVNRLRNSGQHYYADMVTKIAVNLGVRWFQELDPRTRVRDTINSWGPGKINAVCTYRIPARDLDGYSFGDPTSANQYRTFIDQFILGIKDTGRIRTPVILEPDALPHMTSGFSTNWTPAMREERRVLLSEALIKFKGAGIPCYVDVGHFSWPSLSQQVGLLREIGVENAYGFSINVSNYWHPSKSIEKGEAICNALADVNPNLTYVADTGRSGTLDPVTDVFNAPNRKLGVRSTTATGSPRCDAYLWVKPPGESDGNDGSVFKGQVAPGAGGWFDGYAVDIAERTTDF